MCQKGCSRSGTVFYADLHGCPSCHSDCVDGVCGMAAEKSEKDRDANSRGTMLLLRVQLIEYHDKYTAVGHIPSYAYENFCEMYEAYHTLGGNGMITKMKREIDELHLKKKGEEIS